MSTHFFSRYKNYSIRIQVDDLDFNYNFIPWGEFGHIHIEGREMEDALQLHPRSISYGENGASWTAPPGKDIVFTAENDPLPPSGESGTIAQPFGLTSENFPHFLNNLGIGMSADHTIGVNGIDLKLVRNATVSLAPIAIGNIAQIGDLCPVPVDNDNWGLIVDKDNDNWQSIIFGVAKAKVIGSPEVNQFLYAVSIDNGDRWVLTEERTEFATAYPLAIYLGEPIDNSITKVFFFGGISYPIYTLVAEMIYAALNP